MGTDVAFDNVLAMASDDQRASPPAGLTGEGLRIAVVSALWNSEIVIRLLNGVERGLAMLDANITESVSVPGCFEIPLACQALARSSAFDAIIAVGAVVRGETTHYEIVSDAVATGVQAVQLETGVPIAFGVLTVESRAQGLARSEEAGGHNVGEESALVAVEMARLAEKWR